jgi:hypothetical protein
VFTGPPSRMHAIYPRTRPNRKDLVVRPQALSQLGNSTK